METLAMNEREAACADKIAVKDQIIRELIRACSQLGAKSGLMGIACSYGDTMGDLDVLDGLRRWNRQTEMSTSATHD
jgi:hypothetical protein